MKSLSLFISFSLLLLGAELNGQGSPLRFDVGEVSGCHQDTILVPITVTGYQGIMNFSCYVEWDYNALEYLEVINKKEGDVILVAGLNESPLDGVKLIFGTEDLTNPDVSLARTFSDGDTLACIKLVVSAAQGTWPITSTPAVLVDNTFFYVNNGLRAFSEDMEMLPGEVALTQSVAGLDITGDSITCSRAEVNLIGIADNPSTDFSWAIGNNVLSTEDSIRVTEPGLYELRASRGPNCTATTTYEVIIDTLRARPEFLSEALGCDPAAATQRVTNPQGGQTYDWRLNNTSVGTGSEVTISQPGAYQLVATDLSNGCVDTQQVVITPPVIAAALAVATISGFDTLNCLRDSATLSVALPLGQYTYSWSGGDLVPPVTDSLITVRSPGLYTLRLTDVSDGCSRMLDTLIIADTLSPPIMLVGDQALNCRRDSSRLTVTTNSMAALYAFAWENDAGELLATTRELVVSNGGFYDVVVNNTANGCVSRAGIEVLEDKDSPPIEFLAQVLPVNCNRATSPIALLETANVGYRWVRERDTLARGAAVSLPAGNYELLLENERNGCFNDTSFTVVADTLRPVFSIDSTGEITCGQGTVSLELNVPNSAYQCSWNNLPAVDCTLEVSAAGIYVGGVLNPDNGCFSEREIRINASGSNAPLEPLASDSVTCLNRSVQLYLRTPEAGVIYEWRDETGSFIGEGDSVTVSRGGMYSVAVASQNPACVRMADVAVVADTTEPVVTVRDLMLNCSVSSVELSYDSPTTNAIASWTAPDQSPVDNLNVGSGGTYLLVLTNPGNGCSASRSLSITQDTLRPVYQINQPQDIALSCDNPSPVLRVNYLEPYQISWSQFPGTIITNADSTRVVSAGDVRLLVRNETNGCEDSTIISVRDERELPRIRFSAPESFDCDQNEVSVGISPEEDEVYSLQGPAGEAIDAASEGMFTVSAPGVYQLAVRNTETGCQRDSSFTVSAPETNLAFSNVEINQVTCTAGSTSEVFLGNGVGGIPDYTFSIEGRDYPPFDIITGLPDGTFTLRLRDGQNCSIDTTLSIRGYEPFEPQIDGLLESYRIGDAADLFLANDLDPAFTYSAAWMAADTACTDCSSFSFPLFSSEEVLLSVERSDGCIEETTAFIIVDERPAIYLPTVFSPNNDGINDYFRAFSDPNDTNIVKMVIFDRWGQEVYQETAGGSQLMEGWNGTTNSNSPAATGSYVFQVWYTLPNERSGLLKGDFILIR